MGIAVAVCLLNYWVNGIFSQKLPTADETRYFQFGSALWLGQWQPWDWSPLMSLVYAPFAYPGADPDRAFHLTRALLGSLNVVLAYGAARAALERPAAFGYALLIALNAQFLTDYAAHLAGMSVALLALNFILRGRGDWGIGVLFLGAGVRPEFFCAGLLAVLIDGFRPGTFDLNWRRWIWAPIAVCAYAAFHPDLSGMSRQSEAFMEHYAWSMSDMGLWHGDVWNEWQKVVLRDFGALNLSVYGFFRANPEAFLRHVVHNVKIIPKSLADAVSIKAFHDTRSRVLGPLLLVGLPVLYRWFRPVTGGQPQARNLDRLCWASALCLAFLPVWLLIRPRPSYLHMATPFLVLWVAVALAERVRGR